jgi:putative sigma-54 modulation protein
VKRLAFTPSFTKPLTPLPHPPIRNPHSAIKGDKSMEFEFTGRHIDITPAIEQLARKELKRLDQMLDSAPARAHVTVSAEKHRKRTEIVLYWRDNVFTAVGENSDISQSVTAAATKVAKQAQKVKEKFQTKKRGRASVKDVAPVPGGVIEAAPNAPRIITARRYRVKPMTPEEAAILLTDSDDLFIVFRDAESNKIGVLYHRTDGNFGLIEP